MGIAADLDYVLPKPNPVQRAMHVVASSPPGAWTLARTMPSIDRVVTRASRGRTTAVRIVAALPVLVLTTTGRKSGQRREAQLVGVPYGDTLALVGTNFGQRSTPTWVLNLEADPRATVAHRDRTVEVVARAASDAERAEILDRAPDVYIGYSKYLSRIHGRRVRVFLLDRPAAT